MTVPITSTNLRRNNCKLAAYETWLEDGCNKLIIQPGDSSVGPITDALGEPDSAPWAAEFAIIYSDSTYVRVYEYYRQLAQRDGGGGCLTHFSYHYGPCSAGRDSDGFPRFNKKVELRIDINQKRGRHIHYSGEDHIPEARVPGLDFSKIDPFKFINAVETHRKTKQPLHEVLGFTVEPAK